MNLSVEALLDLNYTLAAPLFSGKQYPWEVLEELGAYIFVLGAGLPEGEFDHPAPDIWISKRAKIAPSAHIGGPCIIDHGAEIRHGAFIRGNAIVGKDAVVGNSVELKNALLFDEVQTPHYNYIGDSILGYKAHMGAGSITSNVKSDKSLVSVQAPGGPIPTGRKKFGAIVGNRAEVGCNSVLNPGTVLGPDCQVYPLSSVRGVIAAGHIYKDEQRIVMRR